MVAFRPRTYKIPEESRGWQFVVAGYEQLSLGGERTHRKGFGWLTARASTVWRSRRRLELIETLHAQVRTDTPTVLLGAQHVAATVTSRGARRTGLWRRRL